MAQQGRHVKMVEPVPIRASLRRFFAGKRRKPPLKSQ
jgi:hypothetical protein